jgi:hypothetical protein
MRCSFAFSGALYAWPFHCGVAGYIQEHGLLGPESRLYAASSGAVAGALLACGVDVLRVGAEAAFASNDEHRGLLGPYLRPSAVLGSLHTFTRVLPDDAHVRATGVLHLAITRLPRFELRVVSHFPTREALLDGLVATMAIPGHGVPFAHRARELGLGWCIDGGLRGNLLEDERPGWRTIRVATRGRAPARLAPRERIPMRMRFLVGSRPERMGWLRHGYERAAEYLGAAT